MTQVKICGVTILRRRHRKFSDCVIGSELNPSYVFYSSRTLPEGGGLDEEYWSANWREDEDWDEGEDWGEEEDWAEERGLDVEERWFGTVKVRGRSRPGS